MFPLALSLALAALLPSCAGLLVRGSPTRRGFMSEQPPPSRPEQVARLRRVTVRVPEDYAADLRRFARELRTRQPGGPAPAPAWRRLSPSAELLIDPECQARGKALAATLFEISILCQRGEITMAQRAAQFDAAIINRAPSGLS